jgi:hypothetical protein
VEDIEHEEGLIPIIDPDVGMYWGSANAEIDDEDDDG